MEDYWYVLNVNPEPWAIGSLGLGRRNGKVYPYVGQNAQLAAYQSAVREAVVDPVQIEGNVELTFYFWRNLASYETQSGHEHRKHHADATNMQKATEDALQGILFDNDKWVVDVHSVVMDQGPEVKGKIVINCLKALPHLQSHNMGMLPYHVQTEVRRIDNEIEPAISDLSWGDGNALF
jgi:Holliday junction resolvase RusA-like endonuclease